MYVEKQVVNWCRELFQFPATSSGLIVSGTSIATVIALKAARDALASSELSGLRLAFFSTDRAALERMTRLHASPFFYASLIDARAL